MDWVTVYIEGKNGFMKVVLNKLGDSWLQGNSATEHNLLMFWLNDKIQLHGLKKTLGSKIIFRYRLRFFINLEHHLQTGYNKIDTDLSEQESDMIDKMMILQHNYTKSLTPLVVPC